MDLTEIKKIPIIDVAIKLGIDVKKKKSMCFTGHDKNTPSLSFYEKDNTWKCFGACDKGGDAISLVQEYLQIDFVESVKWFECYGIYQARRIGELRPKIHRPPQTIVTKKEDTFPDDEIYTWFMSKCGEVTLQVGIDYLKNHCIESKVLINYKVKELRNSERAKKSLIVKWGVERLVRSGLITLDCAGKPNLIWRSYCVLFPFFEGGKLTYIQGRMFSGKSKYLNLKGICKPIFNVDKLSNLKRGSKIHLCEGVPDALAMESSGLDAVAILGATSFKKEWVSLFKEFEIVLVPDGDKGGVTFSKTIQKHFNDAGKSIRVMSLPKNKDAADVLSEIRSES